MGNFFTKGATLLLQIIFVVALVLLFAWFDPFDILTPTKNKLKNTPVQVQSIREIGQLITAEYYGEVISSFQEVINEKDYNELQQFDTTINDLHEDFKTAIKEFSKIELPNKKAKVYKAFLDSNPDIKTNPLFANYLYFIWEKIKNNNYRKNELEKELNPRRRQKLIYYLYKNKQGWRDKLDKIKTTEYTEIKKEVIKKITKKRYHHNRLVIIGRGWVKAGFDFRKFSDRNFRYDKAHQRIHFIGIEPTIISATINPWFIPEEGVEGFEFLIAERGARLKPEYTKKVKQLCLDKLKEQALNKQIMNHAIDNAEQNLKNFFSILLNDDIKGVYFHTNYLNYMKDVLLQDSVITNNELYTIDTAINYYYFNYDDKDKLKNIDNFITELKKYPVSLYNTRIDLNNFSSLLFSLVYDRKLDSADYAVINDSIKLTLTDTLWFSNIFDHQYFSNSADSLTAEERKQRNSEFREEIEENHKVFCTNLKSLIESFGIEADSTLLPSCLKSGSK